MWGMVFWVVAPFLFLIAPKILAGFPFIMAAVVWSSRNYNQWPKWIAGSVPLWFGLLGIVSIAWAAFPDQQLDFFMQRLPGLIVVGLTIVTLSVVPEQYFKIFHFIWRKMVPIVLVVFLGLAFSPSIGVEWAAYNRMFVVIAILLITTFSFFLERGENRRAFILYALLCIVLWFSEATAGFMVGLLSLPLLYIVQNQTCFKVLRVSSMIIAPILVLSLPFILPYIWTHVQEFEFLNDPSTGGRIEIWHGLSNLIAQNWGYGWGYDVTRFVELPLEHVFIPDEKALHPHNMAIQAWIEFGIVGALGLAVIWFQLLRHAKTPAVLLTLIGLFIIGSLSYGVW